jgi:hypothetical protein
LVPIISAVVVALAFSAPVASAVEATDNSGTLDGDPPPTRADPAQCANYKKWYDADLAAKPPDKKGAAYTKNLADSRGCRWAERLVVQQSVRESSAAPQPVGVSPGETTTEPTSPLIGLESPMIVVGLSPGV